MCLVIIYLFCDVYFHLQPKESDEAADSCRFVCNVIRLQALRSETNVILRVNDVNSDTFCDLDLDTCKSMVLKYSCTHIRLHFRASIQKNLSSVFSSLRNVNKLELSFCPAYLLKVISNTCRCLEYLTLPKYEESYFTDADIIEFCGFKPHEVTCFDDINPILYRSQAVCWRLKSFIHNSPKVSPLVHALVLTVFKQLKVYEPCSNFIYETLCCMYGTDHQSYRTISQTIRLVSIPIEPIFLRYYMSKNCLFKKQRMDKV